MRKCVFYPWESVSTQTAAILRDEVARCVVDALGTPTEQSVGSEFASRLNSEWQGTFMNLHALTKRYVLAVEYDEETATTAGGQLYVRGGFVGAVRAWAGRYIKRETVLLWDYMRKTYKVGEYGKTEAETETTATGTSEATAGTAAFQRFNNGVTAATSGVSNKTETTETNSGLTTGITKQKTGQGFAREYDGNPEELARANMAGAGIIRKIADAFAVLLIPIENLDACEIGVASKIAN